MDMWHKGSGEGMHEVSMCFMKDRKSHFVEKKGKRRKAPYRKLMCCHVCAIRIFF